MTIFITNIVFIDLYNICNSNVSSSNISNNKVPFLKKSSHFFSKTPSAELHQTG